MEITPAMEERAKRDPNYRAYLEMQKQGKLTPGHWAVFKEGKFQFSVEYPEQLEKNFRERGLNPTTDKTISIYRASGEDELRECFTNSFAIKS